MTHTTPEPTTMDLIYQNILGFMLPFFLSSAGGNAELACNTIRALAKAYNVATATELELVGRILGFNTVAMDNLRLSMNPEMSDTKVLRYRSNAVALSRAGEQCRKILEAMQANREPVQPQVTVPAPVFPAPTIPAPAIAAAPPPAVKAQPAQSAPRSAANKPGAQPASPQASADPSRIGEVSLFPDDIETMKRQAREMLAAFSAPPAAIFPNIPDSATLIDAAVRQALAAAKRTAAA
jgi:hypothetical protein